MKTHSDIEIPVFQNLGTGRWYYHFNHGIKIGDEGVSYTADTVVMSGEPNDAKIKSAITSPVTDKGEPDTVYNIKEASTLQDDLSQVVSYTNDYYRSVTRQDISGLEWMGNEVVKAGQVRTYNVIDYECLQSHITQLGWEPDKVPALWKKVSNPDVIEEWLQPGSTNPYMKGDKVLFNGNTYESVIDNNVWSPTGYPAGWRKI